MGKVALAAVLGRRAVKAVKKLRSVIRVLLERDPGGAARCPSTGSGRRDAE